MKRGNRVVSEWKEWNKSELLALSMTEKLGEKKKM